MWAHSPTALYAAVRAERATSCDGAVQSCREQITAELSSALCRQCDEAPAPNSVQQSNVQEGFSKESSSTRRY